MRLELFKRTDLSLQALERLAESDGGMAGAELASLIGTSTHYLPQVMKPLVGAGWVKATSGSARGDIPSKEISSGFPSSMSSRPLRGQPTTGNVY